MGDLRQHVDEGTIHAWLDAALPPDESARVEAHVASCASCAAALAEARGLIAASSRILAALDDVPGGVLPGRDSERDQLAALRRQHSAARRPWWRQAQFVAAASLLLVAGLSTVVWQSTRDITIPAVEALADAPSGAPAVLAEEPPGRSAVTAPAAPAVAGRAEQGANEARVATSGPLADRAPMVVAERKTEETRGAGAVADSTTARVAGMTVEPAVPEARVAAGARRLDSTASGQASGLRQSGDQQQRAASMAGQLSRQRPTNPAALGLAAAVAREAPAALPVGCYELRGPAPVGGRLLGVPEAVRLTADSSGTVDAWHAAVSLDSSVARATLRWRLVDPVTVELQVLRPIDSTIVRFQPDLMPGSVPSGEMPAGITRAIATRIVCR